MRTFIVTIDGVARVHRTYALGKGGRVITPDIEGKIEDVVPAPDMADEVAKWHPDNQAQVTSIREISEADIPVDRDYYLRDAWEDDGEKIVVNMTKARASFNKAVRTAKLAKARELQLREDIGEDVTAERAALTVTPDLAGADTPAKLKALWPSAR